MSLHPSLRAVFQLPRAVSTQPIVFHRQLTAIACRHGESAEVWKGPNETGPIAPGWLIRPPLDHPALTARREVASRIPAGFQPLASPNFFLAVSKG
jgi:hypothetical protein